MQRTLTTSFDSVGVSVTPLQFQVFYRAIAKYGQTALNTGGKLYFEINPLYADDMREMLSMMSYHDIEIREDQYGKQRMIKAIR